MWPTCVFLCFCLLTRRVVALGAFLDSQQGGSVYPDPISLSHRCFLYIQKLAPCRVSCMSSLPGGSHAPKNQSHGNPAFCLTSLRPPLPRLEGA